MASWWFALVILGLWACLGTMVRSGSWFSSWLARVFTPQNNKANKKSVDTACAPEPAACATELAKQLSQDWAAVTVSASADPAPQIEADLSPIEQDNPDIVDTALPPEEPSPEPDPVQTESDPLHALPAPPEDFIGRAQELAELERALESGGVIIANPEGVAGAGKTALALQLARQVVLSYPDAQFYIDLAGDEVQPLTTAQAMQRIIQAYYPLRRAPEDPQDLKSRYYSVLRGQRALLVMDNAADAAQITELMPPVGSALIVTTSAPVTDAGMTTMMLEPLSQESAATLLANMQVPAEKADEIARLCGGLPLALRLAGGVMAALGQNNTEMYSHLLAETPADQDRLEAIIALALEALPQARLQQFCALAVFAGGFDSAAAAAVWEIDVYTTQAALEELAQRQLIMQDSISGRYYLHPCLRQAAKARSNETEQQTAGKHHAIYYQELLATAEAEAIKGGEDLRQALALFDLEELNIRAGQRWVAGNLEAGNGAANLTSNFAAGANSLLAWRLSRSVYRGWLQAAVSATARLRDFRRQGQHLLALAGIYRDNSDVKLAQETCEQVLEIACSAGDRYIEATALCHLGNLHAGINELTGAIECFDAALAIAHDIGDQETEAKALSNLAAAYLGNKEPQRAIEFQEQALVIDRALENRAGEEAGLCNIGTAYYGLGEYERACGFFEKALSLARENSDRMATGRAFWNLSLTQACLCDWNQSIGNGEMALAIFQETEPEIAVQIRAHLNFLHHQIGN
jgi:tetratricopeptide (TPR) repeat protein